jgi:hypothetical protein
MPVKKNNQKMTLTPAAKNVLRELGRLGGNARAESMTPEERRASAIKASKAAAEVRTRKAAERQKSGR